MLRLLANRHHDLIAGRTRAMGRLPTTVCFLIEGHLPRRLRADRAARHRRNPSGNRQLDHAIHMIAVTQVRNDTPDATTSGAHGNVADGQRDRLRTLTAGSSVKPLPDPAPATPQRQAA